MDKNYQMPPICWLRVTDFMHVWMENEIGCAVKVRGQKVLCVQHLDGVRELMKMETTDDMEMRPNKILNTMSASRKNMLEAGMDIDEAYIEQEYGVTKQALKLFMPIECPKMCLTKDGVLRPWTLDVCLGKDQASALQRLMRNAFWRAVENFNTAYALKVNTTKYADVDMIEDFCAETRTPDVYADTIRREWQRRVVRGDNKRMVPELKRSERVTLLDV
jgi:hypothetical protein